MASKKSGNGAGVFLAHLAVIAVMVVVLSISYVVYVDTKWMHTEIKAEAKELRKLKIELKEERDAIRSSHSPATAGRM